MRARSLRRSLTALAALAVATTTSASGSGASASLLGGLVKPTAASLAPAHVAVVDPALSAALATAGPLDVIEGAVVLDAVPTPSTVAAIAASGVNTGTFTHLPVVAVRGPKFAFEALKSLPLVRSVWLNVAVEETLDQSTAQIQARAVWTEPRPGEPTGYTGRGVAVATIDSGIDGLHPGVAYPDVTVQNVKPIGFKDAIWGVTVEDVPNTDIGSGHGSHVAGIIAGRGSAVGQYRGVAPGASLVGLGASDGLELLTILQSYDWILANKDEYGIRVINNSWASGDVEVPYVTGNPLDLASKAAVDAGLVVVFAAGNAGQSGDVFNRYARNDWVVSVGGVDKLGKLTTFSSRGNETHHADVMAPGHFIASVRATLGPISQANATPFDLTEPAAPRSVPVDQWPYYTVKSGTSMAAPHVSGVVALMLEANPALTPAQVRSILRDTARPVAGCLVIDCGEGVVDALASVRAAVGMLNQPPVAALTAAPARGAAPLRVTFDGSGSTDADGAVVAYRWDWDGDAAIDETTTSPIATHVFPSGAHRVRLSAVDDDGSVSDAAELEVRASDPPVASAAGPGRAKSGDSVTFDASASSDPNGDIVAYEWNFADGSPLVTTASPVVSHTYAVRRPTVFGWSVRVVDAAGASDATGGSIKITP